MEIEKYNNCDEIYHSSSNTNSTYNNTYSGATKALFAKLAVTPKEKEEIIMLQKYNLLLI